MKRQKVYFSTNISIKTENRSAKSVYTHTYIYTYIHAYIIYICVYTYTYRYVYVYIYMYVYGYMFTYIYIYIHIYMTRIMAPLLQAACTVGRWPTGQGHNVQDKTNQKRTRTHRRNKTRKQRLHKAPNTQANAHHTKGAHAHMHTIF